MINELLPIGTVCSLKGGEKKLMITAFFMNSESEEKGIETFDYCGCLYPEGMLDSEEHYLFNHSDIAAVHYVGYVNDEEREFKKELIEFMKSEMNINEVNSSNVVSSVQQPISASDSNNVQSTTVDTQLIDIPILVQQQNNVNPTDGQF